jgi:hypothetical protein
MIIFALLSISTALGFAIGLLSPRVIMIVFVSLGVVAVSVVALLDNQFGMVTTALVAVASLTALQGSYLVGVWMGLSLYSARAEFPSLGSAMQRRSITAGEDDWRHDSASAPYTLAAEIERKARRLVKR